MLARIAKTSLYYRNVSINFLASHKSSEIRYLSPLQTTFFPFISFLGGSIRLRLLGPLLDPDRVGAVDSDGADHLARGRHLSNVLRKCCLKIILGNLESKTLKNDSTYFGAFLSCFLCLLVDHQLLLILIKMVTALLLFPTCAINKDFCGF